MTSSTGFANVNSIHEHGKTLAKHLDALECHGHPLAAGW
jgi:hypothetical protein